nr:GH25 family lysozyme [uncultured Mediterraneibacter sp.]
MKRTIVALLCASMVLTGFSGATVWAQESGNVTVQEETNQEAANSVTTSTEDDSQNATQDPSQTSGQDQTTGENQETGKDQTSGGNAGNADASQTTGTEFTEDKDGNQTGEEGQTPETQDAKEEIAVAAEGASIRYQAHVQTYGWIKEVKDGKEEGTTGQSKRVESMKINVDSAVDGNVEYRAFIQEVGWTDWKSNGAEVGTTGQSKRLEALQVRLTGKLAEQYDVYYSVHAQTYGWLDWAKNGDTSGTVGLDKRLESVKIVLVAKGGQAPGATTTPKKIQDSIVYKSHVQTYGWQDWAANGALSGTTGLSKRVESLQIGVRSETDGGISFRAHVQGNGWTDWNNQNYGSVGTVGQSKRLEAIQLKLTGDLEQKYDVYYRVHCQTYGWLDWAKNGEVAGTSGYAKRIESIQIQLVKKGGAAPGATARPSRELKGVSYDVYVEGKGWVQAENGAEAGTTGEGKRMEALRMYVGDGTYTGSIQYQTYVQTYGWRNLATAGNVSGAENSGKRMEALKINLTGELAKHYDVYYQVHVQTIGWLDWAKNGEVAGTYGQSKRIESIRVKLVAKGEAAPGSTSVPSYARNVSLTTFVQGVGWMKADGNGFSGTTGQSRRIEAFKLSVTDDRFKGGVKYQAYTQGTGWNTETGNGAEAGSANSGKRVEAIKLSLTDELAQHYHIYYRVYVQTYGWLGWAADGTEAGTAGLSKRIESIQVLVVPKVLPAPGVLRDAYRGNAYGVDVSAYNGNVIWSSVKNSGNEFAMLRITTRNNQVDAAFEQNYNQAIANGVRVGVYKYGYATTVEEAKAEAQSVIKTLKGRGLSFPVAYDVEDATQQVLGKEKLTQIIDAFQKEIENAGYKFMIYANTTWLNNYIDMNHYADEDVWVARYRSFGLGHGYTGKGNVTIWQFTSKGSVPGISGYVDRNVAYKLY